jgi:O-antigen/teichoic acid export membrane protein
LASEALIIQQRNEEKSLKKRPNFIFWLESILACATALLTVLAIAWPDWIEALFGLDLDGHSGSAEWMWAVMLALVTASLAALARREWNRAPRASA